MEDEAARDQPFMGGGIDPADAHVRRANPAQRADGGPATVPTGGHRGSLERRAPAQLRAEMKSSKGEIVLIILGLAILLAMMAVSLLTYPPL